MNAEVLRNILLFTKRKPTIELTSCSRTTVGGFTRGRRVAVFVDDISWVSEEPGYTNIFAGGAPVMVAESYDDVMNKIQLARKTNRDIKSNEVMKDTSDESGWLFRPTDGWEFAKIPDADMYVVIDGDGMSRIELMNPKFIYRLSAMGASKLRPISLPKEVTSK